MHEKFLLAALQQARLGQGSCAPNPCVGAVAVLHGHIIAQAFHQCAGSAHAEALLLEKIPENTKGLTIYITLEPCNHWGRTPPCVDLLIQRAVASVVFAYKDPNPIVRQNDSSALLRARGISVTHYPLAEVDDFYQAYSYWTRTKRPQVTLKMAQSFDGAIASASGMPLALSNQACFEFTQQLRRESDLLLTSARTILADDPLFNVRSEGLIQERPVAVLDAHLSVGPKARIFSRPGPRHVFYALSLLHEKKEQLPNVDYHPVSETLGRLDLDEVLTCLGALGYHSVLIEVGGLLFRAFHEAALVHRTYLYLVPKNLGSEGLPAYGSNNLFERSHRLRWFPAEDNMIACIDWEEGSCLLE